MAKVGFFIESLSEGGLRTFIRNLIVSCDPKSEIILVCNSELKKNNELNKVLSKRRNVKVNYYSIFSIEKLSKKSFKFLKIFYGVIFPFIFFNQFLKLSRIFKKINLDKLMIINGGYPGSEICSAACVAWNNLNPKKKIFINFHNFALQKNKDLILDFYNNLIDFYLSKLPIYFISVSKICSKSLKLRKYLRQKKVKTIYNGFSRFSVFSKKKISLRKKYKFKKFNKILLMLAEYTDRKGYDFIFQVMKQLNYNKLDYKLVVFGHGNIDKYKKKVLENKLSNSVFLNNHFSNNLSLIKQSDFLVIPSQKEESFGYTAIEAMSQKKVVIASKTGGLSEIIKDKSSGLLVDPSNPKLFAKKIIQINGNSKLKENIIKNAYLRYKLFFKASTMFENYFKFLTK